MTAEEEKVDAGPDAALSEKEDDDEGSTAKPSNKSSDAPSASPRRSRLRPPRSLEETLFQRLERIYGPGIKRMLTVQYR
jgi:DNA polymerase alpha-associated DNA helicase A